MLVVPILLNMFLISVATKEVKYNVGILDQDSTLFTQNLVSQLKEQYNVTMLTPNDDVKSMVVNRKLDNALVFQPGFTAEMIGGDDVSALNYALDGSNVGKPVQMYISSYLSSAKQIAAAAKGNSDTFYKGMDTYKKSTFNVEYKEISNLGNSAKDISNAITSLGYIAFGMLFLVTFSTALILEDKLTGVFDRVNVTPLTRFSYFAQHLLASFLVASIQAAVLITLMPKLVNVSYGATPNQQQEIVVVCWAFALSCVAIGVAISRFSRTPLMANALTTFINIPLLMLGGCFWPREIMPKAVQKIADFIPTTWFLKAGETVLYGKGLNGAVRELSYLIAFSALLLVISFVFKTEKKR
ncbi:ABC transporter permease [Paenibacillus sp. NPDC057934]|uniref:ABC transporter permease n=1 Tax=Paenibacillus sp. NPDC057934 TaxID=3346282 RepID=UPI0036D94F54